MGVVSSPRVFGYQRCGAVTWQCRLRDGGYVPVERHRVLGGNLDLIPATGRLVVTCREKDVPRFAAHFSECPVTKRRSAERALRDAAGEVALAIEDGAPADATPARP